MRKRAIQKSKSTFTSVDQNIERTSTGVKIEFDTKNCEDIFPMQQYFRANLSLQAERIQNLVFVSPPFFDFYEQLEVAAVSEQFFDVPPGSDANCFKTLGALSDYDLFLTCSLH